MLNNSYPDASAMRMTAGPFSLNLENGFIRHLRHGDNEIVRMIYFALRDEDWGTYPLHMIQEDVRVLKDGFQASYTAANRKNERDIFYWQVKLSADNNGRIEFMIDGTALEDVLRNRAGFCILHPLKECAGMPVWITHPDSSVTRHEFPLLVAPENPFMDIASMQWAVSGNEYTIRCEGDIFETEDQRNWADASYKTFCTPLRLPFPVKLTKGSKVWQRITFIPEKPFAERPANESVHIHVDKTSSSLPAIGTASTNAMLPNNAIGHLQALRLNHCRIDVDLLADWRKKWIQHLAVARATGMKVEAVIFADGMNIDQPGFEMELFESRSSLHSILLLDQNALVTPPDLIRYALALKRKFPTLKIGAGTNYNFTEINRQRFDASGLDFVSYGVDPQEHATDDLTIIENLEGFRHTAQSAAAIYKLPVHVSHVLLKRKFNPYTPFPEFRTIPEAQQSDERIRTPFAAVWLLGAVKHFHSAGARSITLLEAVGKMGLIDETGSPVPAYDAVKAIQTFRGKAAFHSTSTAPLIADAICFQDGGCIVWNYTQEAREVTVGDRKIVLPPVSWRLL